MNDEYSNKVSGNSDEEREWVIRSMAAEARFVYLREWLDDVMKDGGEASKEYVPFDEAENEEQERWIRVIERVIEMRIEVAEHTKEA